MLNRNAVVQLKRIGCERTPVLVIDDLLAEPEALTAFAKAATWHPPHGTYYPGLNADLPEAYLHAVAAQLRTTFTRAFGPRGNGVSGFLALATWGLEQFGPWQRIPHYDHAEVGPLAMVHYLGHQAHGGTAFFRHVGTGFETITVDRRDAYLAEVRPWLDVNAERLSTFAGPSTPGFEMTDMVDYRFNRAVIYPSCILHCAVFEGADLTNDPRSGRLTANTFHT